MISNYIIILTLIMLNCFKDYKRCIHISYHIFVCFQQKNTKFTMQQPYLLPTLYCQWHACWCPGDPRSQGHQQEWYWPRRMEYFVSSIRRVIILSMFICDQYFVMTIINIMVTRWVDGMPTSEVTPVTIGYILIPHLSRSWSHLKPVAGVQSICLLFISWQSDHFQLRYSKFHIWPYL